MFELFSDTFEYGFNFKVKVIFKVKSKNSEERANIINIHYKHKHFLFDELGYIKSVQQFTYHNSLHLFLVAILDAILDFSVCTNNGYFILANS